jgi:hypothetical protein
MSFFEKLYNAIVENWKTTAAGIVTSAVVFLNDLGLVVSPELQTKVTAWVVAAGLLLIGIFAKDGDTPPTTPNS